MEGNSYLFKGVTLMVTHYNRSGSLERLLYAFENLNCRFDEIVVSDDGSREEHIENLRNVQSSVPFRLIRSDVNKGLGNNLNKGQAAVQTPYTLYVQEDFIPTEFFPPRFKDALSFMDSDPGIDMVRFYGYSRYPYLKYYDSGFYEMLIKPWYPNYRKIYYYSDHPHLRRSNFNEKFGPYPEGLKGDRTEYRMCLNFIQRKGRGLFYGKYNELFVQDNSDEPSTMKRKSWTTSKKPLISIVRNFYRQIRYNFDILFNK